jgi:ribonuclease P protein component
LARIIAHPGTGLVGIAVSRKIGSKPRRNRLKRRFRAAIESSTDLLDQRLDYVVVVNAEAAEASYEIIDEEVRTVFAKVNQRWAAELESS